MWVIPRDDREGLGEGGRGFSGMVWGVRRRLKREKLWALHATHFREWANIWPSSCPVTICHTLLRPFSPISGPGRQSFEKTGFFAEFLAGNLFCIRICMNVCRDVPVHTVCHNIYWMGWLQERLSSLLSVVDVKDEIIVSILNDYCLEKAKISLKSEKLLPLIFSLWSIK